MLSHHAMEYSDDEKKSTEFTITELAKNEVIFQTIVLIIFFSDSNNSTEIERKYELRGKINQLLIREK